MAMPLNDRMDNEPRWVAFNAAFIESCRRDLDSGVKLTTLLRAIREKARARQDPPPMKKIAELHLTTLAYRAARMPRRKLK